MDRGGGRGSGDGADGFLGKFGADEIALGGQTGEVDERITLRDSGRGATNASGLPGDEFAQFVIETALDGDDAFVGIEYFALVIFQLG